MRTRVIEKDQISEQDKDTPKGKPRNEPLASRIAHIDAAALEDYWTGASEALPKADEMLWWEVWLDTSEQHTQAWDDDWGSDDHDGHGTEMAGVCLFGSARRAPLQRGASQTVAQVGIDKDSSAYRRE